MHPALRRIRPRRVIGMLRAFLVLLVLATASAAAPAFAQQSQRVRYEDLDLTTPRGVESLQNRIASAARRECSGEEGTASRTDGGTRQCERSVRNALTQRLPADVRARLQPAVQGAGR